MAATDSAGALRLGVLVPKGNVVHEREFARMRPAGIRFSFREFSYPPAGSPDFCDELLAQMQSPIDELRRWGAKAILVGCTTASMQCAADACQQKLLEFAQAPVITAAGASLAAAAALGLEAFSVGTPYGERNNGIVRRFLESQQLRVTAIEGLSLDRSPEVWAAEAPTLAPERLLALAVAMDSPQSQGLYLPCTGIGTLDAIDLFEQRTGKSAFSSVQAGFWAMLTRMGCEARQAGSGRLLETWAF